MPTNRFGKVRRLLKNGLAKVVQRKPFTIRLCYKTEGITQKLVLGIDPGRQNIGLAVVKETGQPVYAAKAETRNRDIPQLMDSRHANRRMRRFLARTKRRRRARAAGTNKGMFERRLPGCKETIVCHDIRNKEARFNNRQRKDHWLTPTADHLLKTHLGLVDKVRQILPVTDICVEINRFAFLKMEHPETSGIDFQNGPLCGFDDVYEAINAIQHGRCILCGGEIKHYHHIAQRKDGGSDTIDNLVGLCAGCHEHVHKDREVAEHLKELKDGRNKDYQHLSVLNQVIPYLWRELSKLPGIEMHAAFGNETACAREMLHLDKDHDTDAYLIACKGAGIEPQNATLCSYRIKQFRRHNRAAIHQANYDRVYLLDGKKVAVNHHKSADQTETSLADIALTVEERSRLTVKPHTATYKTPKTYTQGSIFTHEGQSFVLQGYNGTQTGKGGMRRPSYCVDTNGQKHLYSGVKFQCHNTGLVYC